MKDGKIRAVVCGTTFGQFYMEALKRKSDRFEFVGIVANGSARSVRCAEIYGVELYHSIDELPPDIDLACVIIRSGALGGKGTDMALEFLERKINVIQEQPIHYKDLAVCFKAAKKNGVNFQTGDLYVHLPEVRRFIACAKALSARQEILHLSASFCPQVSYPMVDILEHILPSISPWKFHSVSGDFGPFHAVTGTVGKTPFIFEAHNEIDPDDPDNYMHLLHNFSLFYEAGHLELVDTHGPLCWMPRLFIPTEGYRKGMTQQAFPEHMHENISEVMGDYRSLPYKDMVTQLWPQAVGGDLEFMRKMILGEEKLNRKGQKELLCSSQWHELTSALGFAGLKRGCKHMPIPADIVKAAADTVIYELDQEKKEGDMNK